VKKKMSYRRGSDRGGFRGGYGGGGGRSFPPKPVEVGKVYDLEVTDTSRRGEGIAKIEGLVIFIPGAKLGQKLKVKITRVSARFATGEPAEGGAAAEEAEETGVETAKDE
jgi:predicted RNA-binding protein with TRAM domain